MNGTVLPSSSDAAATRARVLKGSIAYQLDDLIDCCCEEGMPCSGRQRRHLVDQFTELAALFRKYPRDTGSLPEDVEVLTGITERLEDYEVSSNKLFSIQQEFRRLLHPNRKG